MKAKRIITRAIASAAMVMAIMTTNTAAFIPQVNTATENIFSITAEAVSFQPRTTAPAVGSKWYRTAENPYYPKYGMPNCTAYAYGRISEILGKSSGLPVANAQNWYSKDTKYQHSSSTPAVGAVVCWSNAKGTLGHVAVVEKVFSNDKIAISESSYGGKYFEYKTINPKTYCSKSYGYHLQGYIYTYALKQNNSQKDMLTNNGIYTINLKGKNIYLSTDGNASKKGTNVLLSNTKTQWIAKYNSSTNAWYFSLKSTPSMVLNLAADSIKSKTNANLYTFVQNDTTQEFILKKNSDGSFSILSAANSSIALDAYGSAPKVNSNVWSYTYSSNNSTQMWNINKVS